MFITDLYIPTAISEHKRFRDEIFNQVYDKILFSDRLKKELFMILLTIRSKFT